MSEFINITFLLVFAWFYIGFFLLVLDWYLEFGEWKYVLPIVFSAIGMLAIIFHIPRIVNISKLPKLPKPTKIGWRSHE